MQETPWAGAHMKLVLVTAEGHAAPDMNYQVAQPLLALRVETWADFSARLPGGVQGPRGIDLPGSGSGGGGSGTGSGSAAARAAPPPSFEGGHQRCFRSLFVCARGLNITRWPLHGLGQQLARHYRPQLPALLPEALPAGSGSSMQTVEQSLAAPAIAEGGADSGSSSGRGESSSSRGSTGGEGEGERLLRVIFHRRSSLDRQLLNAAELLQRCNAWRHTTSRGQRLRASCQEVGVGCWLDAALVRRIRWPAVPLAQWLEASKRRTCFPHVHFQVQVVLNS